MLAIAISVLAVNICLVGYIVNRELEQSALASPAVEEDDVAGAYEAGLQAAFRIEQAAWETRQRLAAEQHLHRTASPDEGEPPRGNEQA